MIYMLVGLWRQAEPSVHFLVSSSQVSNFLIPRHTGILLHLKRLWPWPSLYQHREGRKTWAIVQEPGLLSGQPDIARAGDSFVLQLNESLFSPPLALCVCILITLSIVNVLWWVKLSLIFGLYACMYVLSGVQLSATPTTVACQAPLSKGFFRQE